MKSVSLLSKIPSVNSYDKTKDSIFGNINQKTLNTELVYGPSLTKALDVQTDFSGLVTMAGPIYSSPNGRKFVLSSVSAGVFSVALYTFDYSTGASVAIGRILVTIPNAAATTHTPRFIRVIDSGTTNWKIFVGTIGSVAINGGVFLANKVNLSDFSFNPSPTQFYMGISSDARAVYSLQDPAALGVSNSLTTIMGAGYSSSLNQLITVKGTAASLSHDGFDTSVAPNITTYPCTGATVNASPTFQMTAHPFVANDPVVITASAPGGFTASTQSAVQTVYFVRNPTANTFELSATSGGASINATTAVTPTLVRAFGISTNTYLNSRKTGTVTTGFAGTALLLDNCQIITPADGSNSGVLSFFLPTTSNFYCWPVASISNGVTSLTGTFGINNTGTGTDVTGISTLTAKYSETLGKIVYTSANFSFLMKSWVNSSISHKFGSQINTWLENTGHTSDYFRAMGVAGLETRNGWLFVTSTTQGQRVILALDARSDASFDYSYLISPVKYVGVSKLKFVATLEQLYEVTDTIQISYRSASSDTDAVFNSVSGGWNDISIAADLSSENILDYVQIRVKWDVTTLLSGIPTQVQDIILGLMPKTMISENWLGWNDKTSRNGESPAYAAFLQYKSYTSPVALRFMAIDIVTKTVIAQADTDTDFSMFDKTSNSGSSWSAMASANDYPNVALTSGIRYKWTGAVPSDVIISWQEK